jgi:hypothetical protein
MGGEKLLRWLMEAQHRQNAALRLGYVVMPGDD